MTMPKAGVNRQAEIALAKEICDACPVYDDCRDWVLSIKPDPTPQMITAGMTPPERNQARKALYAAANVRGDTRRRP